MTESRRRRRATLLLGGIALLGGLTTVAALTLRYSQGRHAPAGLMTNHSREFDFSDPPCSPAPRPANDTGRVLVRYLGVAGLWIEWRGRAVLTAPFFSNSGMLRAGLGSVRWDEPAIRRGVSELPLERATAVLVGHGHYDHIADLPPLFELGLPDVPVYANRSAINVLSAFDRLAPLLREANALEGGWVRPADARGRPAPLRIMPVRSGHADHFAGIHYAAGLVEARWNDWKGRALSEMREGVPFAYLVDLLNDDGSVAFRLHVQDAASRPPLGFPPAEVIDERAVDLAVLRVPGYWEVEGYPSKLLGHIRARHVLAIHYENFFRPRTEPLRFVPTLTDARMRRFFELVSDAVAPPVGAGRPASPVEQPCGPAGQGWTMPLPGEWLAWDPPAEPDRTRSP